MSGDVQPRKRKDKKRKKDELGVEEPRGTAAVLGEGDVFMHSQHEHGTGGHWCAKIIFFSLLAVLITLIGLIILENRGLTELEANSVETRYSGVLEGWLEDAPDDDHHDEHTLELKHHDDEADQDDNSPEIDHDDEDEEKDEITDHDDDHEEDDQDEHEDDEDYEHEDDDDDEHEDDDADNEHEEDDDDNEHEDDDDDNEHEDDDDDNNEDEQQIYEDDNEEDDDDENYQQDDGVSEEQNSEEPNEDDNEDHDYGKYDESDEGTKDDDAENDSNDDLQEVDEHETADNDDDSYDQSDEANEKNEDNSNENEQELNETHDDEDEEEHEDEVQEDSGVEIEKLEKEVSDEDTLSEEEPTATADDDDKSEEVSSELAPDDKDDANDEDDGVAEDEEFLEPDDIEEELPVVEHIVAPKGKPFVEVEEEASTTKPADTLAEEEEYEKQQEELRREQEQASHMWLKLLVGGALLVATHAVVRRATAPRDDTPASDEHASREETPVVDRRMTLIPEERVAEAAQQLIEENVQPIVEDKALEKFSSFVKSTSTPVEESEEEEEEDNEEEIIVKAKDTTAQGPAKPLESQDKELYSDEEEPEDEEEEEIIEAPKETPKLSAVAAPKAVEPEPDPEEGVPDDVEIIDDEQLEEELEEEEDDEEEISDVDDAELLSRLEAKYGRLPEPDRPGQKPKDGGNSIEDDWPGEPSDQYWRQQLDQAEQELRQGEWSAASDRVAAEQVRGSARARWILARAIDAQAEARRDNRLLTRAITAYLDVLKMNERLSDARLLEVANRTLDRVRFRGNYLTAEPVYRLLIRRFPDVPDYHNNLTVSFLMANRADLAEQVLKETLQKLPNDRIALAHHGFVLKTQHNRLEEAVDAFQKALEGDIGPATEPRFYYHLGDALLLLGRYAEAHEVHKRGAALGHFLSPAQRSLYNVERLKSQPWWNIEQTPYLKLARALEKSWKEILKEGEAAKALYEKEKEGLKERGEWSQLDLFVRGQEIPNRCKRAPVTCSIVRSEVAAAGCRRGQVKFSAMEAGTHVRPHVGPTNCRLRMHLGLSNTKDTYLRVDQETRQWQVGKTFMFDDSFEHEVWHNGTGARLVLIVDVWHPALTPAERRSLPAI